MKIYNIALRNIARNKRRSILSASAISVAGFAIVVLFSLLSGMLSDMKNNIFTYTSGEIRIRNSNFDKYERLHPMHFSIPGYRDIVDTLKQDSAVRAVSPRINFPGKVSLVGGVEENRPAQVMAVDFALERGFQNYTRTLSEGEIPEEGRPQALIGSALARKFNADVGDKITIQARTAAQGSRAYTFTITGILKLSVPGMEGTLIQIPLDIAQKFLWLPDQVQEILLKLNNRVNPKETAKIFRTQIKAQVPLNILSFGEVNNLMSMMEMASRIYDVIGILFFLLAGTVIINTTIMVIVERTREIGTLAALGMNSKQIVKLFFLESVFISITGALFGIIAGVILSKILSVTGLPLFPDNMDGLDSFGIGSIVYPQVNFKSTVLVFIYALLVSCFTVWVPSRRAAEISPVEAMRNV